MNKLFRALGVRLPGLVSCFRVASKHAINLNYASGHA
jgi:hypothetical protein